MTIYNLSSGSKGNATLVVCDNFNILIDAGTSKKYLSKALEEVGYSLNHVDMVLVTHFHSDHVKSLHLFDDEIIFSDDAKHRKLALNEDNDFLGIKIKPFELSHDAKCYGYQIKFNGFIYTHISDTGYFKNEHLDLVYEATHLYLEFNHEPHILLQTNRPAHVKKRILSDVGHLNNLDAAVILSNTNSQLQELMIAHISEEANSYDAIKQAIIEVFKTKQKEITFKIKLCAHEKITIGGNQY